MNEILTQMTGKYAWLLKVIKERNEYQERVDRLHAYLSDSRSVDENGEEARELLMNQEEIMNSLIETLTSRIEIGVREFVNDKDFWMSLTDDKPHIK